MRESLYDYCTRTRRQALLEEWDVEGNGALTPLALSHGSRRKVWWCCGAGHQWQAAVYTRTGAESGCPYCAGKRPWPGFNDLASQEPALAAQWHPERNGPLTPDQVVCGSTRRVWWQCGSGHVWAASVKSRAAGAGCPYCAGRRISPGENDLATLYPALARQWHPTKNGGLTPAAGVVAVPPSAHMAGGGVLPEPGRRLPGVHGQDGAAGGKRPGHSVSPAGPAMGPGEERGLDPPAGFTVQQPRRLVAVRPGAQLARGHQHPGLGERLPLLRRAEGPGGVQRPGDPVPRAGPDVGPCPERSLDPGHGHPGKPQEGVVAVPGEPRVESRSLLPHQRQTLRLSGVCREGQPEESGAVPGSPCSGRGGESAGVNQQRASRGWKPKQCNQRRRQKI